MEQREFGGSAGGHDGDPEISRASTQPPSRRHFATSAILGRLGRVHPNHKRIAAGALTIAVLTIIAKALVAVREMSIAWRYGVSGTVDAYKLSLTIVTWIPMLVSSVLGVVLVPRLVALHGRDEARKSFVSELNGSVLALGAMVAVLTYFSAPAAARAMASRLDPHTVSLTTSMVQRLAPVSLFIIAAGYFTARLQAREQFSYTVTEAVPALMIATLVLAPFPAQSVVPLVAGALIGYFGQMIILSRLVARSDPPVGKISLRHRSDEWRSFYESVLVMSLGQLLLTATNPIDQAFAARLGEGAVATLGYANRIIILFSGLASVVIGRALLPVLSAAAAKGDLSLGRRQTLQWSALMAAASVLICAALWVLAPDLVKILFERGAFGAKATANVSAVMRYGLVQLPFFFGGIALVQWIAATGRFNEILSVTSVALVVKLFVNFTLIPSLGLRGIMLGTAAMYCVTAALLMVKVARERS